MTTTDDIKILAMESLALERHYILESFSQIEDFINLIIFQKYSLSYVDDFIQDLLMSERNGFGFKIELLEKLNFLKKTDWNKFNSDLRNMSDIRNYFAHTVLSVNENCEGVLKYRGKRKIIMEVNLDEKLKLFEECRKRSFLVIQQISKHVEKEYMERQEMLRSEHNT